MNENYLRDEKEETFSYIVKQLAKAIYEKPEMCNLINASKQDFRDDSLNIETLNISEPFKLCKLNDGFRSEKIKKPMKLAIVREMRLFAHLWH